MAHKFSTFFRWINMLVDYFILNFTLYAFFFVAAPRTIWVMESNFRLLLLLLNLWWFYSSHLCNVYNNILTRDAVSTAKSNLLALGLFSLIIVFFKFIFPELFVASFALTGFFILFPITILIWKISFLLLRKHRRHFWINYKCAIVGGGPSGINLYNYIMANPQLGYDVLGIFADRSPAEKTNITYLGRIEDAIRIATERGIQEIYCTLSGKKQRQIKKLRKLADKYMIRFRLIPKIKGTFQKDDLLETDGTLPVLVGRREPLENKANELIKWAFDMVFSLLVVVFLLSWLTPVIAIIIKLDSKGPVFFKQLRSGKDNKPFWCLKFRSMAPNTDSDTVQASKNDMRVTRVGAFLRKTSLDELPQFFNVLMGDMSVVGPRPHMLKHTQDYSELINKYMVRQFLTPGITGWAQVNGFRGETKETREMEKRVRADIWYLENWSSLLDLKIIFLTIWQVFKHDEKAY